MKIEEIIKPVEIYTAGEYTIEDGFFYEIGKVAELEEKYKKLMKNSFLLLYGDCDWTEVIKRVQTLKSTLVEQLGLSWEEIMELEA